MKRGKIAMVFGLLLTAAVMASAGSGALDVFSASRDSNMKVVNDATAYLSVKGDGKYAYEQDGAKKKDGKSLDGVFKIDFSDTNINLIGKGLNPEALSKFKKVFTVTNQSAKKLYVWLETDDSYPWQTGWELSYEVDSTTGEVKAGPEWNTANKLIWTKATNFKQVNGVSTGRLSYVTLDPGENFDVDITVDTKNYNAIKGSDWSHKITIKADSTTPPAYN